MGGTASRWLPRIGWALVWVLTIFEALTMGLAGIGKFSNPIWMTWFTEWGYSEAFGRFIGGAEILGAGLLLLPRTAPYAAGGLLVIMIGATWTVMTRPSSMVAAGTTSHLVLLTIILVVRVWALRAEKSSDTRARVE